MLILVFSLAPACLRCSYALQPACNSNSAESLSCICLFSTLPTYNAYFTLQVALPNVIAPAALTFPTTIGSTPADTVSNMPNLLASAAFSPDAQSTQLTTSQLIIRRSQSGISRVTSGSSLSTTGSDLSISGASGTCNSANRIFNGASHTTVKGKAVFRHAFNQAENPSSIPTPGVMQGPTKASVHWTAFISPPQQQPPPLHMQHPPPMMAPAAQPIIGLTMRPYSMVHVPRAAMGHGMMPGVGSIPAWRPPFPIHLASGNLESCYYSFPGAVPHGI